MEEVPFHVLAPPEMKKEKESKPWNKNIHHPLPPACGGHVTDTSYSHLHHHNVSFWNSELN